MGLAVRESKFEPSLFVVNSVCVRTIDTGCECRIGIGGDRKCVGLVVRVITHTFEERIICDLVGLPIVDIIKMIPATYVRWSGLASVLAGILVVVGFLIHPLSETPADILAFSWVATHAVLIVGFAVALLSLPGIHARQSAEAGILGAVSFVVFFLGAAFVDGILFVAATVQPILVQDLGMMAMLESSMLLVQLVILLLLSVGGILFGISIFRAKVHPKRSGILMSVGWLIFLVAGVASLPDAVLIVGGILVGISFLWLGYSIWKPKSMRT